MMAQLAAALVGSGEYEADEDGTTHCNAFAQDFAEEAYGYSGFSGKTANGIINTMRQATGEWRPVHDAGAGKGERVSLQERFGAAQRHANDGYLVVIGQKNGAAEATGGHVAVVMPGELAESGSWEKAGQPKLLPQIAQAGQTTFAGKHLGYGFKPEAANSEDFVIYYRKP
jgi:hypothetical protein